MAFLKKFGQIVLKVTSIVTGFQPLLTATIPGTKDEAVIQRVQDSLVLVAGVVGQAEVFGQALALKGEDKLKAAIPAASQIVLTALVAGKKIKDVELYNKGISQITAGTADVMNSLEGDIETEDLA